MRKTYGPEYPRTLSALLERPRRDPERPMVTDAGGTVNCREFRDRVLRVAGALRRAEVGPGVRVALWLPNGTDYLAAIFACARLGAVAIHINTRFRSAEVGNLLATSSSASTAIRADLSIVTSRIFECCFRATPFVPPMLTKVTANTASQRRRERS